MSTSADTVSALLATLSERSRWIIARRFGLDGDAPGTLRSLGADLKLTAERVRQIERQLLADIAQTWSAELIVERIAEQSDDAWRRLTDGEPYLRRAELLHRRAALAPDFLFLLALAGWTVPVWLDACRQRLGTGWCDRSIPAARARALGRRLVPRIRRDRNASLAPLCEGHDPGDVGTAIALLFDLPIRNGRIRYTAITRRPRRTPDVAEAAPLPA